MRYRELARKLHKSGCEEIVRSGHWSHRKWHNPATGGYAPVPDWGDKDLKIGTVRHIVRLLGLGWDEYKRV